MSTAPAPEEAPKKSGGKNKLFMIGAVVVALAGGGYYYTTTQAATAEHAVESKEVSPKERGLVSFEPFVVNLADPGGQRFVRATVQLVVGDAHMATELTDTPVLAMHARAIILELLATQHADTLVTPEGKVALRQAIADGIAEAVHEVEVVDVLFSDFVVQF
ncbi:MAG TPA: flagellar basal body-associated protein FliL [Vicinamibacterales bacterium]|nr:flagellar basal body-associated protein FliL [Vicinamibacterales bacterium]